MQNSGLGKSVSDKTDELLYRRQFFLGVDDLRAFPRWNRQEIAGKYRLCAHPDLRITHCENERRSITLLGYILDPDNPGANDETIVVSLLEKFSSPTDIPGLTYRLGGRWVIIAHDGEKTVLFHDAAGLRQIYYFQALIRGRQETICASQPGLIAETFSLSPDPGAIDYVKSRGDSDSEVHWMPGDTSQYRDIRALLPNHRLDLHNSEVARYWPTGRLQSISLDRGVAEAIGLLRGLVESARNRYPLSIAMTAGWDSRLMLALGKDAKEDLYCYTMTYPDLSEASRDVWVPAKLLGNIDLVHHLIKYPTIINQAFKNIFKKNSSALHRAYCADAQALYENYPADRMCVTGDVAEIAKCYYRLRRNPENRVSANDLARVSKVGNHHFAVSAFDSWLSRLTGDEQIDLLDLFCWEQTAGRWHAQIRAEYDISQESFAPLNCRSLLETMLAVDKKHRQAPDYTLFRQIISALWSELLLVPINPREKIKWKWIVVDALTRIHLYQLIPSALKEFGKRLLKAS
ncbi:MAG: hypothetical protein WA210_07970 [Burkholderiaceae bacterium]